MKKLLAITTATLAGVLLAAPMAHASIVNLLTFNAAVTEAQLVDPMLAPPANDGNHDFAVGGFEGIFMEHWGFSAQSGPQGQAPSGHLSATIADGAKGRWEVTCLAVEGKDAAIGLVPTEAPPSNVAEELVLVVHDGGPGPAGDKYASLIAHASECARFLIFSPLGSPIMSGDILVHDN
jgi:hypothetical protein